MLHNTTKNIRLINRKYSFPFFQAQNPLIKHSSFNTPLILLTTLPNINISELNCKFKWPVTLLAWIRNSASSTSPQKKPHTPSTTRWRAYDAWFTPTMSSNHSVVRNVLGMLWRRDFFLSCRGTSGLFTWKTTSQRNSKTLLMRRKRSKSLRLFRRKYRKFSSKATKFWRREVRTTKTILRWPSWSTSTTNRKKSVLKLSNRRRPNWSRWWICAKSAPTRRPTSSTRSVRIYVTAKTAAGPKKITLVRFAGRNQNYWKSIFDSTSHIMPRFLNGVHLVVCCHQVVFDLNSGKVNRKGF